MESYKTYERMATEMLLASGHHLVAKDFRMGRFQADVITKKDGVLFVVEVKYRKCVPQEVWLWVDPRQIQRLLLLGASLLSKHQCSEVEVWLVGFSPELDAPVLLPLDVN
jgi:Holliday junction resolvase-like predicted endonuclease